MKHIIFAFLVLGLAGCAKSKSAEDNNSIQGSWQMVGSSCLSGDPVAGGPDEEIQAKVKGVFNFNVSTVNAVMNVTVKYTKEFGQKMLNNMKESLKYFADKESTPDIERTKDLFNKYIAFYAENPLGYSCNYSSNFDYKLEGSILTLEKNIGVPENDCIADVSESDKKDDAPIMKVDIKIADGVMTMTDADPISDDDMSCKKGDKEIQTYKRLR